MTFHCVCVPQLSYICFLFCFFFVCLHPCPLLHCFLDSLYAYPSLVNVKLSAFLCATFSCQASWYENQTGSQCEECGGYTMVRPCPVCEGMCSRRWRRNIDMVSLLHISNNYITILNRQFSFVMVSMLKIRTILQCG